MSETRDTRGPGAPSAPASFGRRSFLFAAAGTGAAGVAAATGMAPAQAREEALSEPDGQASGYRETAHVTRYYRSTRL